MRLKSINRHLKAYSIFQKRKTTINHAFASAIAPFDKYDPVRLTVAMQVLGQTDIENLRCVYCDEFAETWDHLVGLVRNSEPNGNGHQIGNLIPCCRSCNSKKGNRDWRLFVKESITDPEKAIKLENKLDSYHRQFSTNVKISCSRDSSPDLWRRYSEIKEEVFGLMQEADQIANKIRSNITPTNSASNEKLEDNDNCQN